MRTAGKKLKTTARMRLYGQEQIIQHGIMDKNIGHLKAAPQPRLHPSGSRQAHQRLAIEHNGTTIGLLKTRNQIDQGGLARAIGPYQSMNLTTLYPQRHIIEIGRASCRDRV